MKRHPWRAPWRDSPATPSPRTQAMSTHPREREMRHFELLDHEEQRSAIQRLSVAGMGDYAIAAATMLSVEQIRKILGEQKP